MLKESAELLVAEDNPNDLELTLRALRKADLHHSIQVARDGAEALEYLFCQGLFTQRPQGVMPKVILLDLKLRKIDGLEVLRQIKLHERTRAIPVVILTSSRQENDLLESYRLGVNSYIVKSADFSEFSNSIALFSRYWLTLNQLPH